MFILINIWDISLVYVSNSTYLYIEDSDVSGAGDNPIDFVAVQYGHVLRNKIHDGNDWCIYTKGIQGVFSK